MSDDIDIKAMESVPYSAIDADPNLWKSLYASAFLHPGKVAARINTDGVRCFSIYVPETDHMIATWIPIQRHLPLQILALQDC